MNKVRVRFAPSPTGYVHIGSLRTALYNYLFARRQGGDFVLRIEDTDRSRYTEGAVENLLAALAWTGLEYEEGPQKAGDHGPYYQSERLDMYNEHAARLLQSGHAYRCFCSSERLEEMRRQQSQQKIMTGYDGRCRGITVEESERRSQTEAFVIRLKTPSGGETYVQDLIRGKVEFKNEQIDDQVLVKSDGYPTYHLANVVDDHLMEITHVIRGEEWLLSTPKHIMLYDYLDWEKPQFAHLPLLLNPDRSKLSKRQGDVSVEDYRRQGYLPGALLNFVALLGWNRGDDEEIFSLDELVESFSLDRVNKAGAVFNREKLDWMNGIYIRNLDEETYLRLAGEVLKEAALDSGIEESNKDILRAVRKSLVTLRDVPDKTGLFFREEIEYEEAALEWIKKESSKRVFESMKDQLKTVDELNLDIFRSVMKTVQSESGVKGQDLWMPVRAAITGMTSGPELPQVLEILGRERISKLLQLAIKM